MQRFVDDAVARLSGDARARACALGEALSEPKPGTWFERGSGIQEGAGIVLDRRSRMLYDEWHIFINGESFRAGGRDATLMRRLADGRCLDARSVARLSAEARDLLMDWTEAGWCVAAARPTARSGTYRAEQEKT